MGGPFVVGMHREVSIFDHSDPEWVVLDHPEGKSLAKALIRRTAQNPLLT